MFLGFKALKVISNTGTIFMYFMARILIVNIENTYMLKEKCAALHCSFGKYFVNLMIKFCFFLGKC